MRMVCRFFCIFTFCVAAGESYAGFFPTTTCEGDYPGCFNQSFVAGGQVGNAGGDEEPQFELYTGEVASGPFGAGETADFEWTSGSAVPFTLVYDAGLSVVSWDVGASHVSHTMTGALPPTDMILIRTNAALDSTVTIENLFLDGIPVDGSVSTSNGFQTLMMWRDWLEYGFTLTGTATLLFGSDPGVPASELGFLVRVGNDDCSNVPEPATLIMTLPALGVLRRRRA